MLRQDCSQKEDEEKEGVKYGLRGSEPRPGNVGHPSTWAGLCSQAEVVSKEGPSKIFFSFFLFVFPTII